MKKFILQILVFFAIVAVVDFVAGKTFSYFQSRAGGRTGAEWYACKESSEDIIIMGSSRASHHYVPQILTDSLGLSCFNAGQDGNGIILQYGRWKMITERFTPKLVIYDVNPAFDLIKNDNMTYVDRLKTFCGDKEVNDYIINLFPLERLKMLSQMYRYNYKFIEMISDYFGKRTDKLNGFIPLNGKIREEIVNADRPIKKPIIEDVVKLHYLEQLVKDCKGNKTEIIFVASPAFRGGSYNLETFSAISKIAEEYKVPFLYYYESEFSESEKLFKDSNHLNKGGAIIFSADFVNKVRQKCSTVF